MLAPLRAWVALRPASVESRFEAMQSRQGSANTVQRSRSCGFYPHATTPCSLCSRMARGSSPKPVDLKMRSPTIQPWATTSVSLRQIGRPRPTRSRLAGAPPRRTYSRMPSAGSPPMPMLFSPTIGAAIAARFWFLWVRCPACRTISDVDLRMLDRNRDAAVTSLIPALSCRSCRPNAPFAELVRLSRASIADEMHEEHRQRALGE
jgi:hypothetical protein